MQERNKHIVILGAAESGIGTALLAKKEGYRVFVSDHAAIRSKYKQELEKHAIPYEEKGHTERIFEADEIVKSPGIPDNTSVVQQINDKGLPLISDIEFAYRHTNSTIIAVTGSNGKSTTTALTHHVLKKGGLNAGMAGNIGYSMARAVAEDKHYDYLVVEVSSFQLDHIQTFRPHVAVLLNITPDHLDRYGGSFKKYIQTKFKITKNQTGDDHFIFSADDENITATLSNKNINSKWLPFTVKKNFQRAYSGKWKRERTSTTNILQSTSIKIHSK